MRPSTTSPTCRATVRPPRRRPWRLSTSSARSANPATYSGVRASCRPTPPRATSCWWPMPAPTAWPWPTPTTCGHCLQRTRSMTDWTFDRDAIRTFRFVRCDFDPASGVASLAYAFDEGPELVETVSIPGAPFALDEARAAAVERALRLLHLIAGVSYYKAAVPTEIRIDGYAIDAGTAAMLQSIYRNGLGEFAYRNGLEVGVPLRLPGDRGPGTWERGKRAATHPTLPGPRSPVPGPRHALVAIGGGKDSLVTIEALRELGVGQTVCWIGGSQLIAACAART